MRPLWILSLCLFTLCSATSGVRGDDPIVIEKVVVRLVEQVDVPAREAGVLEEILVREGDVVARGGVVAKIDDAAARVTHARAKADLTIAERMAIEDIGVLLANKTLEAERQLLTAEQVGREIIERESQNQLKVLSAEKAQGVAEIELKRSKQAKAIFDDAIPQLQIDGLQLKADQAKLETEQSKFNVETSQLELRVRDEAVRSQELAVGKAELEVKRATVGQEVSQLQTELKRKELELAALNIERRTIQSPLDGVVVEVYRNRGEWVEPGERVMRILRLNRLWVEGFLSIEDLARCRAGAAVSVTVRIGQQETIQLPGSLVFIGREVDPVNQDILVRAEIDNTSMKLLPGMKGELTIHCSSSTDGAESRSREDATGK